MFYYFFLKIVSNSVTDVEIEQFITNVNRRSQSENDVDLTNRINTIISEYKESINKSHLQLKHLNEKQLLELMKRICEQVAPDTLQLFESDNSNINNNNSGGNLDGPERFYDRLMTLLVEQDQKLMNIIRTQQEQQQNLTRITECLLNHSIQISQMMRSQQEQQVAFHQLSDQVQTQQEQLVQLSNRQTQQEASNQVVLETLETPSSSEESNAHQNSDRITNNKRESRRNYLNTLINLANIALLRWTMGKLVRKS